MTSDDLVTRILAVGLLPPRVDTSRQLVLDEVNSEFTSRLLPIFRKTYGGFVLDHVDYPVVANQAGYAIPVRALNSSVDIIKYVDSAGNEVAEVHIIPLKSIGKIRPWWFLVTDTQTQTPITCYLTPNQIVLAPIPSSGTGTLRVYYPRRPGKLVLDNVDGSNNHTTVGTITSVVFDGTNTTITCNANLSGAFANTTIDIMAHFSPFGLLAKDVVTTTAAMGTATILVPGVDLTSLGIIAGDFVTLAQTAYVPEIPQEWHELLLDLSVARWYHKMGNYKSEASMRASAKEKLDLLVSSTTPRVANSTRVLNPFG